MKGAFKSQPFEQMVNVMRNMGYDDEADDIALFRRQRQRRAKPLLKLWRPPLWLQAFRKAPKSWLHARQAQVVKLVADAGVVGVVCISLFVLFDQELLRGLANGQKFLITLWDLVVAAYAEAIEHWRVTATICVLTLFRKFFIKLGEFAFLDFFIGYGFRMVRAVAFLLFLIFGFGWFYGTAFDQGAIVPADKDIRDKSPPVCKVQESPQVWSPDECSGIADQAIPLFNQWLYSADVMVPVVTFGQKAAWVPNPDADVGLPGFAPWKKPTNFVYEVQLVETALGWVEGFLLVSFVTGLIAKE